MGVFDDIGHFFSGVASTIHDDVTSLVSGVGHLFEHTEDQVVNVIKGNQQLIGGVVHEGVQLVDHTVQNTEALVGNIGGKAIDSVKGILTSPVILIAGGAALLLLMKF